jgi:phenylacetyl-CoA:acceptor oxidoreductase subunit 1
MVVDLGRCVGCQTCTIACKMENGLPPGTLWRTVLDLESGAYPEVNRTFFPLTCMQCADPPCHDACPTTATRVRPDGIVWIRDDLCIGCGSCVVACPYRARHLVAGERYYFGEATAPELATYERERVGICTKCHFCFHRFDEAPAGVVPGEHPAYTPACSSSCIADAIVFGDLDRPDSRVSRLVESHPEAVRMLEHLETGPSVYYLHPPRIAPRAPERQHSWHGLAVANFFCGPTGIGLYLLAVLAGWLEGPQAPLLAPGNLPASFASLATGDLSPRHWAGLLAPLLVAVGLLAVAAEAGRPWRGFNVFRNLRRSWMSRESGFALAFIVLAGLDTLFWQQPALQAAAALAGLGVALSQGLILARAKGVPAWNVPILPLHFISSALTGGCGAWLVLTGLHGEGTPWPALAPLAGLALLGVNLSLWLAYLATPPHTPTFGRSVAMLRQGRYQAGIVGLGHLLPALLLAVALTFPAALHPLLVAAGAAMLAGGLIARVALVIKAALLVDLFDRFPGRQAAPELTPRVATAPAAA